jgi:outer membrane lipopolysaccharide assembly protein LptE/RlpB
MNILKKLTYFLFFLVLVNCGFKVIDKTKLNNFKILNVETSGDKKINFLIKNNLINGFSKKDSQQQIKIIINNDKIKNIKEKNIKNQVTKYEIGLISKITIKFINQNLEKTIDVSKVGSYNINTNHSSTINNQNNLEKSLANQLSEEITRRLIILINDL